MKMIITRLISFGLVACFLTVLAPRTLAGPPPNVDLLRQAYVALAHADHDYKGHRVAAMRQIDAAARILGANFRGEGRGHEKQGVSDDQVRAAQGLLQQASAGLSGKVLRHVRAAEKQLNIALSIK
jgi:hypothetical protein